MRMERKKDHKNIAEIKPNQRDLELSTRKQKRVNPAPASKQWAKSNQRQKHNCAKYSSGHPNLQFYISTVISLSNSLRWPFHTFFLLKFLTPALLTYLSLLQKEIRSNLTRITLSSYQHICICKALSYALPIKNMIPNLTCGQSLYQCPVISSCLPS